MYHANIEPSCSADTSNTPSVTDATCDGALAVVFKNCTLSIFCLGIAFPDVSVIPKNALVAVVSVLVSFKKLNNVIFFVAFTFPDKSAIAPVSSLNCIL